MRLITTLALTAILALAGCMTPDVQDPEAIDDTIEEPPVPTV